MCIRDREYFSDLFSFLQARYAKAHKDNKKATPFAKTLVFSTDGLSALTPRVILYHFDEALTECEVENRDTRDLVPYSFRHYFITDMINKGAIGLSPNEANPEKAVEELVSFLPVLAFDGANMTQIDAGGVLDIAMAGTSATLLARKWESALLVNVDNETLRRVLDNPDAMAAVERIEGWRTLGDNIIETIINKSDKIKEIKEKGKSGELSPKEKKELSEEEKEYKSKRKLVQEKLIKFATRIPAFMYLTDFRENTLQDVITKLEPDLFLTVTGLTVKDFNLLVQLRVFNTEQMNQAVFAFRRYEDASLRYTGIESHAGLSHYGLFNTVVAIEK